MKILEGRVETIVCPHCGEGIGSVESTKKARKKFFDDHDDCQKTKNNDLGFLSEKVTARKEDFTR